MSKIIFENTNGGGPLKVNVGGDGILFEEDIPRIQARKLAAAAAAPQPVLANEQATEDLASEKVANGTSAKAAATAQPAQASRVSSVGRTQTAKA